jgi:hypothetical protein
MRHFNRACHTGDNAAPIDFGAGLDNIGCPPLFHAFDFHGRALAARRSTI